MFSMTPVALVRLSQITGSVQFRRLRDNLLAEQVLLHTEMDELVSHSRITSSPMYLQRHLARGAGEPIGNWRLRWRLSSPGLNRHVKWIDLTPALDALPVDVARFYKLMNRRVEEANLVDILLQSQITWIERYLGLRGAHREETAAALAIEQDEATLNELTVQNMTLEQLLTATCPNPRPNLPHEEVMALMDARIARNKATRTRRKR